MIVPPPLRTPAVRLLLVAYSALAGILPAAGRPWLTVPLCLAALAATGALWVRALPGPPAETGVPAARPGLAATAGLITVPLLALLLHAAGRPVRPAPLVIACAALVTVLAAVALLRDHRARRRSAARPGVPHQRHDPTSPAASTGRPPSSPRHAAGLPDDPPPSTLFRYGRTSSPAPQEPSTRPTPSSPAPDPDLPGDPAAAGALDLDLPGDPATAEALDLDLPGDPPNAEALDPTAATPTSGAGSPGGPASGGRSGRAVPASRTGRSGGVAPGSRAGSRVGATPSPDADLPGPGRGPVRTTVAVAVPLVLAAGVGGPAVHTYLTVPHPPEPGYLSVALNGWAAAIDSPVTVPARGLVVPVRVTSAGLADTTSLLQLRIGGQVVASRPMSVAADSVRSLTVYVPALPRTASSARWRSASARQASASTPVATPTPGMPRRPPRAPP
ncbi:hypothetical protein [Actinoplanes sp. CA-252034]|uniref:hypothetical protein n=1 Tax=Actinoplanes sp. CA-252034 TaxID=3239906 RepID=UPI003D953CE3